MPLVKVFFWGMMVSFLGSLPLGTLNVAAMQISVQESIHNAILFSLGSLTVEMIYVRISLVGINWVRRQKKLFRYMEWITVAIVLALAIGSFAAAMKPHAAKNVVLNNNINRYALGVMLSAINPVQIPFWFIWSTYLITNKVLLPTEIEFNVYTIGIGVGTLSGLAIFIFAGKWAMNKMNASQRWLNIFVGIIFLVSAAVQFYKVVKAKPFVETTKPATINN